MAESVYSGMDPERNELPSMRRQLCTSEFFKAFHNPFEEAGTGRVVISLWKSENTSSKKQAALTAIF
jgi:hypothetical protein